MGLDMYLSGKKFIPTNWEHPEKNPVEDGFQVKERTLQIGYWRKHPNLHGYIVQNFAGGVDECQDIDLSAEDLRKILSAVESRELPETKGFFFGRSTPEDDAPTIEILKKAIEWVQVKNPDEWRSVVYRASW